MQQPESDSRNSCVLDYRCRIALKVSFCLQFHSLTLNSPAIEQFIMVSCISGCDMEHSSEQPTYKPPRSRKNEHFDRLLSKLNGSMWGDINNGPKEPQHLLIERRVTSNSNTFSIARMVFFI